MFSACLVFEFGFPGFLVCVGFDLVLVVYEVCLLGVGILILVVWVGLLACLDFLVFGIWLCFVLGFGLLDLFEFVWFW